MMVNNEQERFYLGGTLIYVKDAHMSRLFKCTRVVAYIFILAVR